MSEMGDGCRLISVRFRTPVESVNPNEGKVVVSARHRVAAVYVRQDRSETLFVNDEGEVVARWATRLIERIDWFDEVEQTTQVPSRPRHGHVLHLQVRRSPGRVPHRRRSSLSRRARCPALLDGQRAVDARGGTTEPIEIVQRGSSRLEGRDPCLRCVPK